MQQLNANSFNINNSGGATELQAVIRGMCGNINTGELVQVVEVNASGVAPVGFVTVQPLVYKIDGDNTTVERGIVYNVPYFRLQGGTNAIICDPSVGDIGFCGICSRDISLIKRIREMGAPASRRCSDIADAVFFGGWSNKTPTQYIQFTESGISIKSTGDVNINGLTIGSDGTLTLKDGSIVDAHVHGGVQGGNSNTLPLGG